MVFVCGPCGFKMSNIGPRMGIQGHGLMARPLAFGFNTSNIGP